MRMQKVNKLDRTTGEVLGTYETIRAAAKANYIDADLIGRCLRGILKTSGGYRWERV